MRIRYNSKWEGFNCFENLFDSSNITLDSLDNTEMSDFDCVSLQTIISMYSVKNTNILETTLKYVNNKWYNFI